MNDDDESFTNHLKPASSHRDTSESPLIDLPHAIQYEIYSKFIPMANQSLKKKLISAFYLLGAQKIYTIAFHGWGSLPISWDDSAKVEQEIDALESFCRHKKPKYPLVLSVNHNINRLLLNKQNLLKFLGKCGGNFRLGHCDIRFGVHVRGYVRDFPTLPYAYFYSSKVEEALKEQRRLWYLTEAKFTLYSVDELFSFLSLRRRQKIRSLSLDTRFLSPDKYGKLFDYLMSKKHALVAISIVGYTLTNQNLLRQLFGSENFSPKYLKFYSLNNEMPGDMNEILKVARHKIVRLETAVQPREKMEEFFRLVNANDSGITHLTLKSPNKDQSYQDYLITSLTSPSNKITTLTVDSVQMKALTEIIKHPHNKLCFLFSVAVEEDTESDLLEFLRALSDEHCRLKYLKLSVAQDLKNRPAVMREIELFRGKMFMEI